MRMDLKPKFLLHAAGLGDQRQEHLGKEQGGTEEEVECIPLFILKGNQKSWCSHFELNSNIYFYH